MMEHIHEHDCVEARIAIWKALSIELSYWNMTAIA